jgi:His/Glu/Gln/Arg/opine family amino acid ABC transporter permease subunit
VDLLESIRHYLFDELFLGKLLIAAKWPFILTAMSMPLAVVIGLGLALLRRSERRWLSWPAATYIEVVRGTPLLVQMFLVYYSLPLLGQWLEEGCGLPGAQRFFTLDAVVAAVVCLAGNYAAYEAEIHRAGIDAVDRGQREAALSLGMSEGQAFRHVVLPQSLRIIVPPVINDLIAMLKDSCVASVITVPELLNRAQAIARANLRTGEMYVLAAAIYMALSLACYALGKWIECRLRKPGAPEVHLESVHGH